MAANQTLYAALDLDPDSAANAVTGYSDLEVTANPARYARPDDHVQILRLPSSAEVSQQAKLGPYTADPASAISTAESVQTRQG
jgi:hypothetical protein